MDGCHRFEIRYSWSERGQQRFGLIVSRISGPVWIFWFTSFFINPPSLLLSVPLLNTGIPPLDMLTHISDFKVSSPDNESRLFIFPPRHQEETQTVCFDRVEEEVMRERRCLSVVTSSNGSSGLHLSCPSSVQNLILASKYVIKYIFA